METRRFQHRIEFVSRLLDRIHCCCEREVGEISASENARVGRQASNHHASVVAMFFATAFMRPT